MSEKAGCFKYAAVPYEADSLSLPEPSEMTRERTGRRLSLLHYSPPLVLLMMIVASAWQHTDPDLWAHVRFGQATLHHRGLIMTDPYSYSALGRPWHNTEWLAQVVMALFYNSLGVFGLKLWKFGCAAATILFVVLGLAETGAAASVQFPTLTIAAVALAPQMQFRPQLFTFLLFAALLAILARDNYRGSGPLWLAIPIMALWVNLHGGYIIGVATLGTYAAVVGVQDLLAGRGLARGWRLGFLALAGTLATLLSPYGIGNWLAVLNGVRINAASTIFQDWKPLGQAMISQWRFSHWGVAYYLCVLGLIAAFVISFVLEPKDDDLTLVALAAVMSLSLIHI